VGGFLLLPEDELLLVDHFMGQENLALLASDDLRAGPRLVERLVTPQPLRPPAEPLQQHPEPHAFIFWAQALGPLRTIGEAPPPASASERVERLLTDESAGGDSQHVLDWSRSPIIRWSRANWHENGALCPGRLQAQPRKTKEQPPELLRLHSRLSRWMKKQSTRIDPFEHAPSEVGDRRPQNLQGYATWAFPAAEDWVRRGGNVWPWNA
jgi:hypothetical protein